MLCRMFIRRTMTGTGERGEVYHSHRLVRSERNGEKVRQRTLLNLGSDFPVERRHWAVLCARIRQLLDRQGELVPLCCPEEVERHAQRIVAQLLNSAPSGGVGRLDLQTVDVGTLELIRPRSVGVEHVGPVGHGAARSGGAAGAAGLQRHAARAGDGQRHRPHGPAGLGARLLALAVRAFGAGRAAGRGLRAHEHDAPVPRLRCPARPPCGDRGASVCAGDGSVRGCATR